MSYKDLKDLIDYVDQSSLAYVNYQTDEQHVVLSKEMPQMNPAQDTAKMQAPQVETAAQAVTADQTPTTEEAIDAPGEKTGEAIVAPMIGVVYLQPQPDADVFVKVGDRVEQGDVVCIIEAMKLMNEIQAPHSGIVTEILVENEEVVEYNQPLIRID